MKHNTEPTDLETRPMITKPLKGSPQNVPTGIGAEKSSRGYGSASLLEAPTPRRTQKSLLPANLRELLIASEVDSSRNRNFLNSDLTSG